MIDNYLGGRLLCILARRGEGSRKRCDYTRRAQTSSGTRGSAVSSCVALWIGGDRRHSFNAKLAAMAADSGVESNKKKGA
jgi:hypothetical protein